MVSGKAARTAHRSPWVTAAVLVVTAAFLPVEPVAAAVACHCFRDRQFQPSQPASADPYVLATARNSLLAAAAGVGKGEVVRQRMTGASETDLWLSLYLSARTGTPPDRILAARDRSPSWAAALDALKLPAGTLGAAFDAARRSGDADAMAAALADTVLASAFGVQDTVLTDLRRSGADTAAAALSLLVARRTGRGPEAVYADVSGGRATWGALINALGVPLDTTGDLVMEAVLKAAK